MFSYGWNLEPEEAPVIVLPENQNKELFNRVRSGEKLYFSVSISRLNFGQGVVRSDSAKRLEIVPDEKYGKAIKYKLGTAESLGAGPFSVEAKIVDGKKVEVSEPIKARWLVHGFFARIHEINSEKSVYAGGENLELGVDIVNWSYDFDETGTVEARLETEAGETIILEKPVEFTDNETHTIDFSDHAFEERTVLKRIGVVLNAEGEEEDTAFIELKEVSVETPPVSFEEEEEEEDDASASEMGATLLITGIIAGIIILAAGIFIFKKKKGGFSAPSSISIILIFLSLILVLGMAGHATADCRSTTANAWISSHPDSSPFCGDRVSATAYASMRCGTCMNGVTGRLSISPGGSCYLGDQGHNWDYLQWGPCTRSWVAGSADATSNQTSNYSASVSFNEGCHCCGSSDSTGTYSVTCTPPNNPPVVDSLEITNSDGSGTIQNHFGTAEDAHESVTCSGEASDPDTDKNGKVVAYEFALWTKKGNIREQMDEPKYSHSGTTDSNSVSLSREFEISDGMPVGTEIYCKLTVTDDKGASVTASTK